jgi:hypothetical protein
MLQKEQLQSLSMSNKLQMALVFMWQMIQRLSMYPHPCIQWFLFGTTTHFCTLASNECKQQCKIMYIVLECLLQSTNTSMIVPCANNIKLQQWKIWNYPSPSSNFFETLGGSSHGHHWALETIIDRATRWPEFVALRNKRAHHAANAFDQEWLCRLWKLSMIMAVNLLDKN